MPSPFPGMDPYLESHWGDVRLSLLVYLSDALQGSLPPSLCARIDERLVTGMSGERQIHFAERRSAERHPASRFAGRSSSSGLGRPVIVGARVAPFAERFIKIIDFGSGDKVVTIIEILSPTNKTPGEAMASYKKNQARICRSDTNLVEIDLLRGGGHALAFPLLNLHPRWQTPYMACVRRATTPEKREVYSLPVDRPLPAIKIPLRPTDADAVIDLQPLIEQCYKRGGYDDTLDYNEDPDPPFVGAAAEWADRLLRESGFRTNPPAEGKRKRPRKPRA